ncbi:glucuronate isomerase [Neorhodopirellula pilleata]|uniref:Glucuronate isomerase n=1 Tax=Neorhodopirellula pilleata TaxID=2714738 RepID=A0A5C6AQ47_9BACT|nr:glucuronate isomerase [Neorhodopirellula pilleata]TWU02075.1 glucuronate isomerase [Neorhodopirellula pilleata]
MTDYFSEPGSSRTEIYQELAQLRLIDPHTHINPHAPASTTLADLLGYHYYTELARSAGMPKHLIEDPSIGPKELVERLVGGLGPIENTIQYSWLIAICKMFFGFDEDKLHLNNWEELYDRSESIMASAQWPDMVLDQSNIEAVFLTNDFDDDLAGFDSDRYIPCLRTDDLVFHLADPKVRGRLAACTGIELDGSLSSLRASLHQRFEHFVNRGARACAISLPPSFTPISIPDGRASTALDSILKNGLTASPNDKEALSRRVFWTLAELCDEFGLPFDLMIGVNRKVYPDGVYQGQDLFDSRVSLIQYKDLFNSFPDVKFPVSVLASVTNQELVSYAWIFPNVYPNGHWWYSNTPSTIKHDLGARLDAVPKTKMIGYYSDAYKLEFVWPKFDMYRKTLASVLAEDFVESRGWSIEQAVELGRQVLKENTEEIFPRVSAPSTLPGDNIEDASLAAVVTGVSSLAEPEVIEVEEFGEFDDVEMDDVEMIDENDNQTNPTSDDSLGAAASLAASSAAAAAAVGLAAAEMFEDVVDEDSEEILEATDEEASDLDATYITDDRSEDVADDSEVEVEDDDDDEGRTSELFKTVEVDPFDTSEVKPNQAVSTGETESSETEPSETEPSETEPSESDPNEFELSGADSEEPFEIEEEHDDTFDTMVMEPAEREADNEDDSTDLSAPVDASESEEDLGATIVLNEHATKIDFGDDSAATVVDHPPTRDADLNEILAVDADDSAEENSAIEDLSATMESPFPFLGENDADLTDESELENDGNDGSDDVADLELLSFDEVDEMEEADEEQDLKATIPVDLSATIDPIPDDDEIGELDLDDVELFDTVTSRATDVETLSAEIDDEPLDVGNLLSTDDGASADESSSDDDSPLVFDSLTDELEGDDSDSDETRGGDAQIRQLTGDSSFSPDEESLKLESDPMTGELNFKVSDDEDDVEEFTLSPQNIEPATADNSGDDDDDEFNLEWLNEDDK